MATAMEGRVERLVTMSRAVLDRLDRGDRVSGVLPQARAIAELYGDPMHVHWLDCEIYGLVDVPFAEVRRRKGHQKAGAYRFCELHAVQDVRQVTVDGVLAEWGKEDTPDRSAVFWESLSGLERAVDDHSGSTLDDMQGPRADQFLQALAAHRERRRVLERVRAYLYQYMNSMWSRALQERDNLRLLGPDYRIVVHSLDALETGVGQELLAALGRLASTNPAEWALSALACRNVILGLGRTLFPLRTGTHHCAMLDKDLQLKGERELNWLTAFIDVHWEKTNEETKKELHELAELVRRVYETGSRGKNKTALGHKRVQELVVDTFRLVSRLKEITSLEPLDAAAVTGG